MDIILFAELANVSHIGSCLIVYQFVSLPLYVNPFVHVYASTVVTLFIFVKLTTTMVSLLLCCETQF